MKQSVALSAALVAVWWIWSGHAEAFLLALAAVSVLIVIWLCRRMNILDSQSVPLWLGSRPFTSYLPWLVGEIFTANVEVTRVILSREMRIQPTLIDLHPRQKTELGRVILANSITLTPGTVSVDLQGDCLRVHALSPSDAADDMSGDIDKRVCQLEAGALESGRFASWGADA